MSPSSMDDEEQAAAKSTGGMLGGIGKMANMVSGKDDMAPSQQSLDNALDEKITEMEKREIPVPDDEIEMLKKQKLALKDELYQILRKASAQQ